LQPIDTEVYVIAAASTNTKGLDSLQALFVCANPRLVFRPAVLRVWGRRAAEVAYKSLTDFFLESACLAAEQTLLDQRLFMVSGGQYQVLMDLLERSEQSNDAPRFAHELNLAGLRSWLLTRYTCLAKSPYGGASGPLRCRGSSLSTGPSSSG
jgi:hypothetical protein